MKAWVVSLLVGVLLPVLALAQDKADLNTISSVQASGGTVTITGTRKPNFTTFTMTDPPRLVIDISEAVFAGVPEEITVGNGTVTGIRTASYGSDQNAIARVLIGYEQDVETDIAAVGNQLVVKVAAGTEPSRVAELPPRETGTGPAAEPPAETTPGPAPTGTGPAQAAVAARADEKAQQQAAAEASAAAEVDRKAQEKAAAEASAAARVAAEAERKRQAEAERAAAETRKQAEAEAARIAAEDKKRQEADARAQAAAEKKRQEDEARAQAAADKKRQEDEARAAAEAKKQAEADARAQAAAEKKRQQEEARAAAEAKKQAEADARAAAAEEKKRQREDARAAAEAKKQAEADARAEAAAEKKRQREEARAAAEAKKQAEAEERERREQALAAAETKKREPREGREARARAEPREPREEATEEPSEVTSRRKTMTLVGFQQQASTSRVFIRTNEPVRYSVSEANRQVVLELENTRVEQSNNTLPLDTSFFDTAVASVDPRSESGRSVVRVVIRLKESVTFRTRQEGSVISLEFPRPSRR
jgi:hypothetical protein